MLYKIRNLVRTRPGDQGYSLLIRHLELPENARIAITGPSGCGKSTTLDILGLSLRPDSADEFLFSPPGGAEVDVPGLWASGKQDVLSNLRLAHMGYVLQSGELLPFLTTGENMMFTARLTGMAGNEAQDIARRLTVRLGIESLWNAMPGTLSVGERQRAAIVRALASRPAVILADEPTAALDPLHAGIVMEAFLESVEESGSALILVTHNASWAAAGGLTEVPFEMVVENGKVTAILDNSKAQSE